VQCPEWGRRNDGNAAFAGPSAAEADPVGEVRPGVGGPPGGLPAAVAARAVPRGPHARGAQRRPRERRDEQRRREDEQEPQRRGQVARRPGGIRPGRAPDRVALRRRGLGVRRRGLRRGVDLLGRAGRAPPAGGDRLVRGTLGLGRVGASPAPAAPPSPRTPRRRPGSGRSCGPRRRPRAAGAGPGSGRRRRRELVERPADLSRRVVARSDAAVLPEVVTIAAGTSCAPGSGGHRRAGAERRREGERQGADATHDRGRC
jgi:hypothetical protein